MLRQVTVNFQESQHFLTIKIMIATEFLKLNTKNNVRKVFNKLIIKEQNNGSIALITMLYKLAFLISQVSF